MPTPKKHRPPTVTTSPSSTPDPLEAPPRPKRPTPRELADRAALNVLRLRGMCLATVQQAHATRAHDDHSDGAAWAYSEAIDAIALERHATRSERIAEYVRDDYEIVASGPVQPRKRAPKGGAK